MMYSEQMFVQRKIQFLDELIHKLEHSLHIYDPEKLKEIMKSKGILGEFLTTVREQKFDYNEVNFQP